MTALPERLAREALPFDDERVLFPDGDTLFFLSDLNVGQETVDKLHGVVATAIRSALDAAATVVRAECQHPRDTPPVLVCLHVGAHERIARAIEALKDAPAPAPSPRPALTLVVDPAVDMRQWE